jgi:hypothetical protein
MSRDALNTLRDRMLEAPDEIDEQRLPERFTEARAALRDAIARIEASGIANKTLITVMLSECCRGWFTGAARSGHRRCCRNWRPASAKDPRRIACVSDVPGAPVRDPARHQGEKKPCAFQGPQRM